MGPSRSFWNGTTSELQPGEITSKGHTIVCTINKSAHTKKNLETYLMILVAQKLCLLQKVGACSEIVLHV